MGAVSNFLIKLHVIAELKVFKDSVSLGFYLQVSVLCFLSPKAAPESAEKRKQEKGMESSQLCLLAS